MEGRVFIMNKLIRAAAAGMACLVAAGAFCACAAGGNAFPTVSFEDGEVTVNGKVVAEDCERVYFYRIDSSVVSMAAWSDDGDVETINVDVSGSEIKLSDVITDPELYEEAAAEEIGKPKIVAKDAVYEGPEVDRDAMEDVLLDYDKAMELSYIIGCDGVSMIYKEDNGASYSVTFGYDSGVVDNALAPEDGIICQPWMTGRVGYGITGMKLEGFADHWAEDSLEIDNYDGHTYYWFCVAYKDDDGDKTYYSVIAEETDDGREVVSAEEVDGPFMCCNLEEFSEMLDGK